MGRPRKDKKDKAVVMGFSTSPELRDWFFKRYPKENRSAIFTQLLSDHKNQIETEKAS